MLPLDESAMDALHTCLGRPRDMVVVDLRDGKARGGICHRRGWARGGWRTSPLPAADPPWNAIAALRIPTAMIVSPDNDLPEGALHVTEARFLRWSDGRVEVGGEDLRARAGEQPDTSRTSTVLLTLTRVERLERRDLPLDVPVVRPPAADQPIAVELLSGDETVMPAGWYGLPEGEGGRGILRIDVEARLGPDRWALRYVPDGKPAIPLRSVPPPFPSAASARAPIERLAVILDRTCPDRGAWSAARAASLGRGAAADPFDPEPSPRASTDGLNTEIRAALVAALQVHGGGLVVDGWTVADIATDGIAWPAGLEAVGLAVVPTGTAAARDVADLFAQAGWVPGLDLWDPVEVALEGALDRLESDPARRTAVLVVGNSPPNPLLGPTCPFRDVPAALGPQTSVRRQSARWAVQLSRAEHLGVPVAWVFLEGHRCLPADAAALDRALRVQDRVRAALATCVDLTVANADHAGVLAGVTAALDGLSTNRGRSLVLDVGVR